MKDEVPTAVKLPRIQNRIASQPVESPESRICRFAMPLKRNANVLTKRKNASSELLLKKKKNMTDL